MYSLKKLSEIATIGAGNSAPQDESFFIEGLFPFIRTSDVGKYKLSKSLVAVSDYLNDKGTKGLKLFKKGTILIPKSGASTFLNHRVIMGIDGYVSSHLATITAQESLIMNEYLFYYLIEIKAQDLIQDHKYPSLNLSVIGNINIPLPPLSTQLDIVARLDSAMAEIETLRREIESALASTRELWESTLESIFVNGGKDWEEKKISELMKIKHGFAFKSEYFSFEGGYVLLTPGNFYEKGGYRERGEKQKYYTGDFPKSYILAEGDLLVAMTEQAAGLLGSPILIPESNRFLHNQRLGLIEFIENKKINNDFLFHFFNTKVIRKEIHDSATGVKVRHTSPEKIGKLTISFPPLSEQSRIVTHLDAVRAETERLEGLYRARLASLDELRQSVLAEAFV